MSLSRELGFCSMRLIFLFHQLFVDEMKRSGPLEASRSVKHYLPILGVLGRSLILLTLFQYLS